MCAFARGTLENVDQRLYAQSPHVPDMLPDIAIFGPYTYLVTIVFWGSVAAMLIYRANAGRRAIMTIAVLYPIGYIWDWYTLHVGVFDIILRTGIDIAGIPLEEHLFIIVVPAMVIGVHENLHQLSDRDDSE